jgi:hypothetical protein
LKGALRLAPAQCLQRKQTQPFCAKDSDHLIVKITDEFSPEANGANDSETEPRVTVS